MFSLFGFIRGISPDFVKSQIMPFAVKAASSKDGVVTFLDESFNYCSGIIPKLTEEQLAHPHNSPDGRLTGREILLAMYIHVAHHRGQAEIYLRDKGIKPPPYMI